MDAFELDVSQRRANKRRRFFVVQKFFEVIEASR
jgi:hypothetical protein